MAASAIVDSGIAERRAEFYDKIKAHNLAPLWEVLSALVSPHPLTHAVTVRWRFPDISPLVEEACGLITAAEAERRVLILENPGMPGQSAATSTLYAGLQAILPGEIAPAHRHSQSAFRFIMSGYGAFTALNGERALMSRYDLVLTPNWVWHDHGNETAEPMVWLDGLDIPLIRSLDASFAEHRPDRGAYPTNRPSGDAQLRWGSNMRPARCGKEEMAANPLFIYSHRDWRASLYGMRRAEDPHAHDAYRMEFVNPAKGGPVLDTMSAFAQLIPAGFRTKGVRSSDSSIHVVTEGRGEMIVGDVTYDVAEGDIIVVPTWTTRSFHAMQDLVLFSYSDKSTQEKLCLWREELMF